LVAGSKGGLITQQRWLPLAPSGSAEPRLGADERRHDQVAIYGFVLHLPSICSGRRLVVGRCHPSCWAR